MYTNFLEWDVTFYKRDLYRLTPILVHVFNTILWLGVEVNRLMLQMLG